MELNKKVLGDLINPVQRQIDDVQKSHEEMKKLYQQITSSLSITPNTNLPQNQAKLQQQLQIYNAQNS